MLLLLVIISYFISTNPLNVPFWYPHVQDCLQHFHQPVERIACCVVGENVKVATTAPPPYLPSDGLAVLSRLAIRSNEEHQKTKNAKPGSAANIDYCKDRNCLPRRTDIPISGLLTSSNLEDSSSRSCYSRPVMESTPPDPVPASVPDLSSKKNAEEPKMAVTLPPLRQVFAQEFERRSISTPGRQSRNSEYGSYSSPTTTDPVSGRPGYLSPPENKRRRLSEDDSYSVSTQDTRQPIARSTTSTNYGGPDSPPSISPTSPTSNYTTAAGSYIPPPRPTQQIPGVIYRDLALGLPPQNDRPDISPTSPTGNYTTAEGSYIPPPRPRQIPGILYRDSALGLPPQRAPPVSVLDDRPDQFHRTIPEYTFGAPVEVGSRSIQPYSQGRPFQPTMAYAQPSYTYGYQQPRGHSYSGPSMHDRVVPFSSGYPQPHYHDGYHHEMGQDSKQRKRRGNLPKETTDKLRFWFHNHLQHPYPTEDEKQSLMRETGLQMNQISNWFINARRRALPALINSARAESNAATRSHIHPDETKREGSQEEIKYLPNGERYPRDSGYPSESDEESDSPPTKFKRDSV